jgi:TetR/AcrR family transcriptional regulator
VKSLLATELRTLLLEKAAVVQAWVDAKRMAKVDGIHLFFTIWAATQTYADFDVQICAVLEQDALTPKDFDRATEHVVSLILRGCGL